MVSSFVIYGVISSGKPNFGPFLIDDSHNVDEMILSFVHVLFSSIRVGTVAGAIMARAILSKRIHQ